ncbi:MAG: molybdopterin molybdotransferase MoeA [Saprospiraceae bacterium]
MLTVEQATGIILTTVPSANTERIPLSTAYGRVLREEIRADRDFPPYHRVSMDGIAIQYEEFVKGRREFDVIGQSAAGSGKQGLPHPTVCIEVATGGVLPDMADTVVPYEHLRIVGERAIIETDQVVFQQNIHQQGADRRQGDGLLFPGKWLGAAELAVLATVGQAEVLVSELPDVAIISTGDELVKVNAVPLPWQIRQSHPSALSALLGGWARHITLHHSRDIPEELATLVRQALSDSQVVLLTGGVSAGKKDYVPAILDSLGVEIGFHKVSQRPGNPLLFGRAPGGTAVFALPGNPVSAFMCTCRYVLPWLRPHIGIPPIPNEWAVLAEPLEFKPDLTWFVPVALENDRGTLRAFPKPGHGSGDLANLHEADGFLELLKGRHRFEKGEVFPLLRYTNFMGGHRLA